MMRKLGPLTLAILLLLAPAVGYGQTVPSNYRFLETTHAPGLFAGYLLTDTGELDLGPHEAPLIGARYTLHLTGPLSVEANLGFAPTQRTLYARAASGSANLIDAGDVDMYLLLGDANLKFHLTGQRAWRGIAPFGILGGGFVADVAPAHELETVIAVDQRFDFGFSFAANVGLGTDFFLTERFSLRAEARDYLWRLAHPVGLTATGTRENDWTNNFALTLGGAIHF